MTYTNGAIAEAVNLRREYVARDEEILARYIPDGVDDEEWLEKQRERLRNARALIDIILQLQAAHREAPVQP